MKPIARAVVLVAWVRQRALLRQCERELRHHSPPNLSAAELIHSAGQALADLRAAGYWLPPGPTLAQLRSAATTEMQFRQREAWVQWAASPKARRSAGARAAVGALLLRVRREARRLTAFD